jgi:hypothetical protein
MVGRGVLSHRLDGRLWVREIIFLSLVENLF